MIYAVDVSELCGVLQLNAQVRTRVPQPLAQGSGLGGPDHPGPQTHWPMGPVCF